MGSKKMNGDQLKMSKAQRLVSEFHCKNPEAPQHISTLNFADLPFHPITNFTDTPDMVPSGWATGHHALGYHAFEGGLNVRVCPIQCLSSLD